MTYAGNAYDKDLQPKITGVLANDNRAPIRISLGLPNKELVQIQKPDCLLLSPHRRPSLGSLDPGCRVIISRDWWGEQRKE